MTDSVESWSGKGRADENFPVGSALIRPALRPHVHAFYAFARNADDIADSPDLPPEDKIRRLDIMEAVLLGHAASTPPNATPPNATPPNATPPNRPQTGAAAPSAAALRTSLAQTGVTPRHAQDLLTAFRQDATKRRYASWAELHDYCRFSAMPVGRHVLDLHGENLETHAPSDPLCAALQILNHLQDGSKDLAALDRCYLPDDHLAAAGATVQDLAGPHQTPQLRHVFDTLLDQVDRMNDQAADLPRRVRDRRLRMECAVIVGLSRRLARRLRKADPVATRVKLRKIDVAISLAAALRYAA